MKILCTGTRGWIGGMILEALSDTGEVHTVSCSDEMSVVTEAAQWADMVIHCGGEYTNDRGRFVEGNIEQAVALAKGCAKTNNTVIFLSSVKIYGWAWSDGYVCTERDVGAANDQFGRAKLIAENIFADAATRSVMLRISNVYGEGVPAKYAIGTMLKSTKEDGEVVLNCNGESARDFVSVHDVVGVVVGVLESIRGATARSSEVINVSSGELVTLNDVAGMFETVLGTKTIRKNGRVLSSPGYANGKAAAMLGLKGGRRFDGPRKGIVSLLNQWAANNSWSKWNEEFTDNSATSG